MDWGPANARARGLSSHLLGRAALLRATASGTWTEAVRLLVEHGYPAGGPAEAAAPDRWDRWVGRVAARRVAVLRHWLPANNPALALHDAEAELLSLRALLRGAVQGASPAARLRDTLATPDLPERALERLSRAESAGELVAALRRLGHPAGRLLETGSLWRSEIALTRMFAQRITRSAAGGGVLRRVATALVDLANAEALVLLDHWNAGATEEDVFLPGGDVLTRERYATARRGGAGPSDALLRGWFASGPLAGAFEGPLRALRVRARRGLVAWLRRVARRDPLGPGALLELLERIRAEAHDVRLIVQGIRLGAAPAAVAADLVTAA